MSRSMSRNVACIVSCSASRTISRIVHDVHFDLVIFVLGWGFQLRLQVLARFVGLMSTRQIHAAILLNVQQRVIDIFVQHWVRGVSVKHRVIDIFIYSSE